MQPGGHKASSFFTGGDLCRHLDQHLLSPVQQPGLVAHRATIDARYGTGTTTMRRRISRRIAAASLRRARASADLRPCFQFARRLRSRPSGVRGPVLGRRHPAAAILHGGTATGRSTAGAGAASGHFPSRLKRFPPAVRMWFIGFNSSLTPSARWAPGVELLTAPATIAWPPSDTCTCCTVTNCRPPVLIRPRVSSPSWYAFIILAAALVQRFASRTASGSFCRRSSCSARLRNFMLIRCAAASGGQRLLKTVLAWIVAAASIPRSTISVSTSRPSRPRLPATVSRPGCDRLLESPVVAVLFRGIRFTA